MARFQNTATYRGKGQKHLFARVESLQEMGVCFNYENGDEFAAESRWDREGEMMVAIIDGQPINDPIGLRKCVVAAEKAMAVVWRSNGKVGSHQ